jgi:putative ABC transport system permease protein
MTDAPRRRQVRSRPLTGLAAALFRAWLPYAERDEVLADLAAEHVHRAAAHGRLAARVWLWRQLVGSLPALIRRSWWRGCTGFEPSASRMRPGGPVLETWIIDLRYSARRLATRRAYTALAVLTLALGAGGTAAIFSVARPLLLDPLPVAREDEVGIFWLPGYWRAQEFVYLRPEFPGFQQVAAIRPEPSTMEIPGEPLRLVQAVAASAELFDVLGVGPLLGRTFQPGDDRLGAEPVAVLSHGMWQELGAGASIIGRQITLGDIPRTIVGVMPRGFWFPDPTTRVWLSARLDPERAVGEYALIGRVAQGGRLDDLQAPLSITAASLGERFRYEAGSDKLRAPAVTPLREHLIGDVRPAVVATLGAMALILLIACVNVAALMLGQVAGRAPELAMRTALGAERRRLVQQIVIESLLVGVFAAVAGTVLAVWTFGILLQALPLGALADTASLDWTLVWTATLIALLAAAAIALVPGTALWRSDLRATMSTVRTAGISGRGGPLEGGLVVAQIALAVLLAAGAGLLVRSVANLRGIEPGVDVSAVAVLDVMVPAGLNADERRRRYLDALPALQELPGVRAAAVTQKLPLRGPGDDWGVTIQGRPDLDLFHTYVRVITHDYFRVLGIHVRQGRGFLATDRAGSDRVVVINEAFAATHFPGEDPLGRVLHTGFDERGERIIGVVNDVAEAGLTDGPVPARYMLYEHVGSSILPGASFALRATSPDDVLRVLQAARSTLQRDAPHLAIHRATTMQTEFDRAVGPAAQVATLLSLLAGLALVLGGVGVYGVISHFAARRTRDYGICIALGLAPARVTLQVVRTGLALVAIGSAIGVVAALALTRILSSLLYGIGAADPLALSGAVLALLVIGALAAFVPAWRAGRTDPVLALRQP